MAPVFLRIVALRACASRDISSCRTGQLQNLLVPGLPLGILGLKRQSRINHHGQVGIVFKAD
jgi:hypothetical protein